MAFVFELKSKERDLVQNMAHAAKFNILDEHKK